MTLASARRPRIPAESLGESRPRARSRRPRFVTPRVTRQKSQTWCRVNSGVLMPLREDRLGVDVPPLELLGEVVGDARLHLPRDESRGDAPPSGLCCSCLRAEISTSQVSDVTQAASRLTTPPLAHDGPAVLVPALVRHRHRVSHLRRHLHLREVATPRRQPPRRGRAEVPEPGRARRAPRVRAVQRPRPDVAAARPERRTRRIRLAGTCARSARSARRRRRARTIRPAARLGEVRRGVEAPPVSADPVSESSATRRSCATARGRLIAPLPADSSTSRRTS